ncbi:MAG: class I SAM-dependent methyltransferase [Pseudomonadales bacterium]|nr:class I SAM-dependent methyltransferase [Pseudomonadales bacterium]
MDSYHIKRDYKINELNITNDKVNSEAYWNRKRSLAADIYQFPVYKFLCSYIRINNIDKFIDIGCGVGRKLEYVHNKNPYLEIIGIDQDDPISYCKNTHTFGEWYADDFEKPNLSENIEAKLVLCSDVIEHLTDPDLLLEYIKTKMEENGVLIISTPERNAFRGKHCNNSPNKHHIREWNFDEFERYLDSRGFEVLDHFVQYPIKMKINMIFFNEIIRRALAFKALKYNQVVVARVK